MPGAHVADVAETIKMAVAPVFLLTAAASFLSVLSSRLSRVVDRARVLDGRLEGSHAPERTSMIDEIAVLVRRRVLIHRAITAAVSAALLVCLLIAVAFLGALLSLVVAHVLAALFIAAISGFVIALLNFLREIVLASQSVQIRR